MFKYFILTFVFVASVHSQGMNFNFQPKPNPWSGNWLGGGQSLGAKVNYDRPQYGISGHAIKNFQAPGVRVGVEGRYTHPLGPNTDLYITGSHGRHIGPGPAHPVNGVGVGIQHRF